MTGHCSTTLNASDVRSDTRSPEQGCRRVGGSGMWAHYPGRWVRRDGNEDAFEHLCPQGLGEGGMWPSETLHFGHWLLSQACAHPSVTSGTISSQQTCSFTSDSPSLSPSFHLSVPAETLHSWILRFSFFLKKNQVYICIYFVVWELFFLLWGSSAYNTLGVWGDILGFHPFITTQLCSAWNLKECFHQKSKWCPLHSGCGKVGGQPGYTPSDSLQ